MSVAVRQKRRGLVRPTVPSELKLPRGSIPRAVSPQLAVLQDKPPSGERWLHEIKFDGYRVICRKEGARVRIITRRGHDWSDKFPSLVAAIGALLPKNLILDGEVCALDQEGRSSFQLLQRYFRSRSPDDLVLYLFDLLFFESYDLRGQPLLMRKELLEQVLYGVEPPLLYSSHVFGDGSRFYSAACAKSLEGIVSKDSQSTYAERRAPTWVKCKCAGEEEFVIVGYTLQTNFKSELAALLLGSYDRDGQLIYRGKVGTGFDAPTRRELLRKLSPLSRKSSPLAALPRLRGVQWVTPRLVAMVRFTEWTEDGRLRHPSYLGLRLDKTAGEVTSAPLRAR